MYKNILFILMTLFSAVSANITETNEIATALKNVDQDAFVFINITGTMYQPSNSLSDHQWRTYFAGRVNKLAVADEKKEYLIDKVKNEIVLNIPKKPVEPITAQLIADLQKKHIPVLGITKKRIATTYADNFGEITSNHLLSIGIDLRKTLEYFDVITDDDNSGYSFGYGILFSNGMAAGPALKNFLNRVPVTPSKIVMVDNTLESLESAELALESIDIPFEGFRYGCNDARKANFDPTLGTIEFFAFKYEGKILSEAEALIIKKAHPDTDFEAMLDLFIITNIQ